MMTYMKGLNRTQRKELATMIDIFPVLIVLLIILFIFLMYLLWKNEEDYGG